MTVRQFFPSHKLKGCVTKYVIIDADTELQNVLLPDVSVALAFRIRGNTGLVTDQRFYALPFASVSGLRNAPRTVSYLRGSAMLIVLLEPIAAVCFLRLSPHELFGHTIDLKDAVPAGTIEKVEDQLSSASDDATRIEVVETFLSSIMRPTDDPLAERAVKEIMDNKGVLRIGDLPGMLNISNDAFEKRFRKRIGASPKQFAKIVRLRALISNQTQHTSFTDLALAAGYYDQSHFNHEFKSLTGHTPAHFFSSVPRW